MKYILGLDLGTNSIGWYLLDELNNIIDRGVVIFPIGTNVDKNGIEKSKNATKREFRAAKRLLFRYKLRRRKLLKLLQKLQLLPKYDEFGHLIKTFRLKQTYQAKEFYEIRKNALDTQINLDDLGRIFMILNKYRGFKSGSKSIIEIESTNDEEGKVKTGIEQLKSYLQSNNSRTYGEYFHKMFVKADELYKNGKWHNPNEPYDERAEKDGQFVAFNSRGIRKEHGRFTDRSLYEKEFDLIWDKQKEFYPNILTGSLSEYNVLKEKIKPLSREDKIIELNKFKQTNYWKIKHETIFFQRPLKSVKKFVSKCPFLKNKYAAPISSFLYQEFRILKQIADLRYSDSLQEIENQPIPESWRNKISAYLEINPRLNLKSTKKDNVQQFDLYELLELDRKNISFNFDNDSDDKYFKGNVTQSTLYNVLGGEKYELLKNNIDKNGNNKLEKLWHLIYMKKDDEWLETMVLSDKTLWSEFENNDDLIRKLSKEVCFEDGYGTYSTKALRNIIPHFKNGLDERYALEKAGYLSKTEKEDIANWQPIDFIKPLKNGELRNPVVEKAIAKAIKLINSILKKHSIDRENWIVRIESTRELKKPKQEREKLRVNNSDKEKNRILLADFLNKQRLDGKLPTIKKEIFKNDAIIQSFELWLEMSYDKNDTLFEEFSKITKPDSKIRHKLWLECGRLCPYTNKTISLSALFTPGLIEIEHIIPYSRSLDDSFSNKTLTFKDINKKKGSQTAYEFMKHEIKEFTKRIKSAQFSDAKLDNFTKQKVPKEFTHDQISNTSYIAKAIRGKVKTVCKEVYFTNGAVTAELRKYDWKLSGVLDEIRYEEEAGVDISKIKYEFYRLYLPDFEKFRQEQANSTDIKKVDLKNLKWEDCLEYQKSSNNPLYEWWLEIEKFNQFRNKSGKKDRSDHRHHALDALIIAMCTVSITQQLSTIHAQREKSGITYFDELTGEILREKIERPISYAKIRESLKDILVVNKSPQRLFVAKTNRTKKKNGFNIQKSHSVRASFHQDTFYGKLKNPELHLDANGDKLINKPIAFVTRNKNDVWSFTDVKQLESIYDKDLKEIIQRRIEWFNEHKITINQQAYEQYPLYRYSPVVYKEEPLNPISRKTGKPLPIIKKVRTVFRNFNSIIELPSKRDFVEENEVVNLPYKRYANADGNYIMALYELIEKTVDKKTKTEKIKRVLRDFEVFSSFEAVQAKNAKRNLFKDIKERKDQFLPLYEGCNSLKKGDLLVMFENEIDKNSIDWNKNEDLKKRLYVVSGLSSLIMQEKYEYGLIGLCKHSKSKAGAKYQKGEYVKNDKRDFIELLHTQLNAIKVKIDDLGNIEKKSNN